MRYQGRLTDWDDAKGFGFVMPHGGGPRAFVHISAFERRGRRPVSGDILNYEVVSDAHGRSQAARIRFSQQPQIIAKPPGTTRVGVVVAVVFALVLLILTTLRLIPVATVLFYLVVSCVTFMVYAFDKAAAIKGRWRTPEQTLHLLELLGGWPGALIAQTLFRHKSRKPSFQTTFWAIVLLNCATLSWWVLQHQPGAWLAFWPS